MPGPGFPADVSGPSRDVGDVEGWGFALAESFVCSCSVAAAADRVSLCTQRRRQFRSPGKADGAGGGSTSSRLETGKRRNQRHAISGHDLKRFGRGAELCLKLLVDVGNTRVAQFGVEYGLVGDWCEWNDQLFIN